MQEMMCRGCVVNSLVPQGAFSGTPQETETRQRMRGTWVVGTW